MAVNILGLRRNLKNVAHNYTDAQVKVREATSNDPWGPSSTMMSEIADLTYNVVAFSEIMQMVWKRLSDHGKNWRHVYKALVLLEYLIKTGSEKVAQQCKENILAIQTLKDFQYLDDNKDQGINVREKAKALVALLKDDERLKNERMRALKAKERFAQSTAGIGSDTVYNYTRERHEANLRHASEYEVAPPLSNSELEAARPQTAGEEELQLQLALAMSREEAEQEETRNKSDDMRLQMALQKSKQDDEDTKRRTKPSSDLLDLDFGNLQLAVQPSPPPAPFSQPPPPTRTSASALNDPWGMPAPAAEPAAAVAQNDPWGAPGAAAPVPAAGPTPPVAPAGDAAAASVAGASSSDPWSPVSVNKSPSSAAVANRTSPMPAGFALGASMQQQAPMQNEMGTVNDPWNPVKSDTSLVPLKAASNSPNNANLDPFSPQAQNQLAEFDMLRGQIENDPAPSNGNTVGAVSPNPFDMNELANRLAETPGAAAATASGLSSNNATAMLGSNTGAKPKTNTVQNLLGEHLNLVNLDNLVSESSKQARNPFEQQTPNPFQAKVQKPPMKDLLTQNNPATTSWNTSSAANPNPQAELNPFF